MRRRGFTFIELSVVIIVLALFAVAVVPNIASTIEGGKRRAFRQSVITLVQEARSEAVSRGQTVDLSYPDNGFQLAVTVDDQQNVLRTVPSVNGVETTHFTKGGQETGDTSWVCSFYADGTCDGGSFEFDEGNNSQTVTISKRDGRVTLNNGQYDQSTDPDERWDAGGYVQAG